MSLLYVALSPYLTVEMHDGLNQGLFVDWCFSAPFPAFGLSAAP